MNAIANASAEDFSAVELAEAIADAINDDGRATATVDDNWGTVRINLSRQLSRRRQRIGYFEVEQDDATWGCFVERNVAHYHNIAETVVEAYSESLAA